MKTCYSLSTVLAATVVVQASGFGVLPPARARRMAFGVAVASTVDSSEPQDAVASTPAPAPAFAATLVNDKPVEVAAAAPAPAPAFAATLVNDKPDEVPTAVETVDAPVPQEAVAPAADASAPAPAFAATLVNDKPDEVPTAVATADAPVPQEAVAPAAPAADTSAPAPAFAATSVNDKTVEVPTGDVAAAATVIASDDASPAAPAAADASPAAPATASAAPAAASASPAAPAADGASPAAPAAPRSKPAEEVPSVQHLYGRDMVEPGVESLPMPEYYVTCGRCKSLFAIAESDLGEKGKGCRVKCSVCSNNWYQSRDRLFAIPVETHEITPQAPSDLERIARNMARGGGEAGRDFVAPDFMGIHKLYIGNLDFRTKEADLLTLFESVVGTGEVCNVHIVNDHHTGRSRGFAFVSFYEEEFGQKALELNGVELDGRDLSVREPNNNWGN